MKILRTCASDSTDYTNDCQPPHIPERDSDLWKVVVWACLRFVLGAVGAGGAGAGGFWDVWTCWGNETTEYTEYAEVWSSWRMDDICSGGSNLH